jgi:hypothetical protein
MRTSDVWKLGDEAVERRHGGGMASERASKCRNGRQKSREFCGVSGSFVFMDAPDVNLLTLERFSGCARAL